MEQPEHSNIALIANLIAFAIMAPLAWYLKAHYVPILAAWSRTWFH